MKKQIFVTAVAVIASSSLLSACGSDAPKPLEARNVSAPLKPAGFLPPGVSSALKEGDAVSLKAPTPLRVHPTAASSKDATTLPPGTLVRLKSRVLNASGSWWLVDAPNESGWMAEAELLRK